MPRTHPTAQQHPQMAQSVLMAIRRHHPPGLQLPCYCSCLHPHHPAAAQGDSDCSSRCCRPQGSPGTSAALVSLQQHQQHLVLLVSRAPAVCWPAVAAAAAVGPYLCLCRCPCQRAAGVPTPAVLRGPPSPAESPHSPAAGQMTLLLRPCIGSHTCPGGCSHKPLAWQYLQLAVSLPRVTTLPAYRPTKAATRLQDRRRKFKPWDRHALQA
jgi:hypothetical protein